MKTPIFGESDQKRFREVFIEECRQKAWGAICNAAWISKELDAIVANYTKLAEEDHRLEEDIKAMETALDHHTVENRKKRKALNVRRQVIKEATGRLAEEMQHGQQTMANLHQSAETNLALAGYAEEWEWKEVEEMPEEASAATESV